MMDEQRRHDVGRWLRFAKADLEATEYIANSGTLSPHIGCFHAQQAAEKAIKGALIWIGIEPPRRHDLDLLRTLLPADFLVRSSHQDLSKLTDWGVEIRYPGDWIEATESDSRIAARLAREIWETVLADLHSARLRHESVPLSPFGQSESVSTVTECFGKVCSNCEPDASSGRS